VSEVVGTKKKIKNGVVVKVSGDKTVSVLVSGLKRHSLYGKVMRFTVKYLVHDETNRAKVGDQVSITEVRPLSKLKRWCLVDILAHTEESVAEEREIV